MPLALAAGKRYHVHGVGQSAVDYLSRVERLPRLGEKLQAPSIQRLAGGQVATALVALSRWGMKTVYSGKFGDDAEGTFGREQLAAEGVDQDGVVIAPGEPSQTAMIFVDAASGERTIIWQRSPGMNLQPAELQPQLTEASHAVLIDGLEIDAAIAVAQTARQAGCLVMLDADVMHDDARMNLLVSLCDMVIGSTEFPQRFTHLEDRQDALRALHQRLPPAGLAGCTLGPGGAELFDGHEFYFSAAFQVEARDSTGAGDIFHAAFLYAALAMPERGLPFRLDFANACAALNCTALGARGGIPTLAAALRLAAQRGAE